MSFFDEFDIPHYETPGQPAFIFRFLFTSPSPCYCRLLALLLPLGQRYYL